MKRSFVIFAFCFFVSRLPFDVSHLYTQFTTRLDGQPTQEWVRRYTDTSSAQWSASSVKMDSLGFIYVLGETQNDFGFLKYNSSGNLLFVAYYWPGGYASGGGSYMDVSASGDVYITGLVQTNFIEWMYTVKFNSNGVFQWGRLYSPDNDDAPSDLKIDKAGNVIIVGGSLIGNQNYCITLKYNPNGDTVWTRHFNNGQTDGAMEKVITDSLNNIYALGYLGTPGDCLIMKYSPQGNMDWFTTFTMDSSNTNIGQGIALDIYGNLYVTGTASVPFAALDNYLLKLNNSGSVLWNRVYSGVLGVSGGCELPTGPSITSDGNSIYYVTDCDAQGGAVFVTLKYNSSGDSIWTRTYPWGGGAGIPVGDPTTLKLDRLGNCYITGYAHYTNTGNDFVTIKYLPNGSQQWVATYSGEVTNGGDGANDIFIDTSLNVYVTGRSPNLYNGYDAVTIKYSQLNGIISNINNIPREYKLNQNYPNPFNPTTVITYELPRMSRISLCVYNTLGQLVRTLVNSEQNAGYYSIAINMKDLASGVYFYQLVSDGNIIDTKKLALIK